ncbi:hypothetical protein I4U23_005762 [Adineta vaga]|nr:hypothetical protein I4U23_005762 [Adineta vaga]
MKKLTDVYKNLTTIKDTAQIFLGEEKQKIIEEYKPNEKVRLAICGYNSSGKTSFLHELLECGKFFPTKVYDIPGLITAMRPCLLFLYDNPTVSDDTRKCFDQLKLTLGRHFRGIVSFTAKYDLQSTKQVVNFEGNGVDNERKSIATEAAEYLRGEFLALTVENEVFKPVFYETLRTAHKDTMFIVNQQLLSIHSTKIELLSAGCREMLIYSEKINRYYQLVLNTIAHRQKAYELATFAPQFSCIECRLIANLDLFKHNGHLPDIKQEVIGKGGLFLVHPCSWGSDKRLVAKELCDPIIHQNIDYMEAHFHRTVTRLNINHIVPLKYLYEKSNYITSTNASFDIYSLGVLMYMVTPKPRYDRPTQITQGHINNLDQIPETYRQLILQCINTNPKDRPTAKEVVVQLELITDQISNSKPCRHKTMCKECLFQVQQTIHNPKCIICKEIFTSTEEDTDGNTYISTIPIRH